MSGSIPTVEPPTSALSWPGWSGTFSRSHYTDWTFRSRPGVVDTFPRERRPLAATVCSRIRGVAITAEVRSFDPTRRANFGLSHAVTYVIYISCMPGTSAGQTWTFPQAAGQASAAV